MKIITHPEYDRLIEKWHLITLIVSGDIRNTKTPTTLISGVSQSDGASEMAVAAWGNYLWLPARHDTSAKARQRRRDFVKGSSLLPATSRTMTGSIGTVFRNPASVELDANVAYLADDANGNGLSIEQSMQEAFKYAISKGRCGLFVDYQSDLEVATKGDIANGRANARILIYKPEAIVNWLVKRVGAVNQLSRIDLLETYTIDEETHKTGQCVRSLRMEDGLFTIHVCYDEDDKEDEYYEPRRNDGSRFDYIPFYFIGSDNNDYKPDEPPLYLMAELNAKHLEYSAIRNESVRTLLPTALFSYGQGFDSEQFSRDNPNGIELGSNNAYLLPESSVTICQAVPNDAACAEMEALKQSMVEAGALLITPTASNISTNTAQIQQSVDTSVIAVVTNNVEQAYNQAINEAVVDYMGGGESVITLSRDFFNVPMTAQERQAWANDVIMGNVTREEYRAALISDGVLPDSADAVLDEL